MFAIVMCLVLLIYTPAAPRQWGSIYIIPSSILSSIANIIIIYIMITPYCLHLLRMTIA